MADFHGTLCSSNPRVPTSPHHTPVRAPPSERSGGLAPPCPATQTGCDHGP